MPGTRNTPQQCVVSTVRRQSIARRRQRVRLHLRVGNRLIDGQSYVAQSRSRDRDQQGLESHQSCRQIGKARFNQLCSGVMGDDHDRIVLPILRGDQQHVVGRGIETAVPRMHAETRGSGQRATTDLGVQAPSARPRDRGAPDTRRSRHMQQMSRSARGANHSMSCASTSGSRYGGRVHGSCIVA